jgi:hypothetical protein
MCPRVVSAPPALTPSTARSCRRVFNAIGDNQVHYFSVNDNGVAGGNHANDGRHRGRIDCRWLGCKRHRWDRSQQRRRGRYCHGPRRQRRRRKRHGWRRVHRDCDAATAQGISATAYGGSASAIGTDTTAIGVSASANGDQATAVGHGASAVNQATALGSGTIAGGASSVAVGLSATSSGASAVALGRQSSASGDFSMAMGYLSQATADRASRSGRDPTPP